ncbi:MAG: SusD/RagB family nutrient-binding outer membrane lipoprotein, partial [Bacteroidota bacterium]
WIQFANFIEARANLHWSKTGGTSSLDAAISALGGSFTANAEGAYFPFSTAPTETAPWYQYNEQRRDIAIGDSYVDLMNSLNDPRVAIYGAVLDNDHPLFIRARNYPLGTYKEVQFMLAEANFQKGEQAAAYTAYINAITADFQELEGLGLLTSADLDTYIGQAEVDPGEANLTLEDIMTQKYIAMFADPEVFVDWRRTGIPALTPNSGTQVPRRLPYPEQEILFNSNTPTQLTIFDRVTWDN